jgi:hypothetical protein
MALNPPGAGLRRIRYDAKSTAKVQVHVAPGDELHVSDDVAAQLLLQSAQFKDVDNPRTRAVDLDIAAVELVEYPPADDDADTKPKRPRKS